MTSRLDTLRELCDILREEREARRTKGRPKPREKRSPSHVVGGIKAQQRIRAARKQRQATPQPRVYLQEYWSRRMAARQGK